MTVDPDHLAIFALAVAVGVLAVARAVRLVVDDDYPPMETLREAYLRHSPQRWNALIECPWCVAPYLAAPAVAWFATLIAFDNTWNDWLWWLINGWAAVSWAAAWLTLRDVPPDQRG